jgi:hypothetical protein
MDALRERVAKYLGAKKEDIVFVPNASHGMNAVLRSLKIQPGEKILYLNTACVACIIALRRFGVRTFLLLSCIMIFIIRSCSSSCCRCRSSSCCCSRSSGSISNISKHVLEYYCDCSCSFLKEYIFVIIIIVVVIFIFEYLT